ncbi:hypothetical protein RND81_01G057800 [Saponaria officinalis]|uniref:NAC domain-containing protein n=1 Tax=Saponaria officinalis TaxID=3572 RepID=A0AAW1N5X7_SAPOF
MEHLPPGFRFYPTEEELISFYLHSRLHYQEPEIDRVIPSIDIYNFEPSQLPEQASKLFQKESEQWFFFTPQQEREARGGRPNRTTDTGYWKATGSPSYVYSSNNKIIGVKKTMVFYKGKAPYGKKTKWKMNEYKAINQIDNNCNTNVLSFGSTTPKVRQEISLCRVYITSGCARAFDRRPHTTPSSTTTTTSNDISASQNNNIIINTNFGYSNVQVEVGQGSHEARQNIQEAQTYSMHNKVPTNLLHEKSCSLDNNSNNSSGDYYNVTQQRELNSNQFDDFEMTETLDSLTYWEQLLN